MIMHIYDEIDYRLDAINEEILLVPRTGANISDKTGDAVILRHFVTSPASQLRQLKKLHHLQRGLSPLLIKPWRKLPLRKLLLTTHQQRRQLLRSLLLKSL